MKPGYKKTQVGVIPEEWKVRSLSAVSSMKSGEAITASKIDLYSKYPCYGGNGLRGFTSRYTHEGAFALIGRQGALCGNVVGVSGKIFASEHAVVVTPREGTNIQFLTYVLGEMRLNRLSEASAQPGLSVSKLLRLSIGTPPNEDEQRAIATALSDVDGLLGGLDRLIAKKRDLKQAAMQQLLTGQTRLPGFHGEWQTKPLGELITHCFSGATPRRNRPDFFTGDIRWITSGELNYNVITDTLEKISAEAVKRTNLAILPAGTFLMAITGLEAEGTRGACGIVGASATTNQSCMAVFPTSELVTQYLFYYYVLRGKSLALQYCQGTKQQSYTAKLVRQLPIQVPPTPVEQTAIAEVLTEMDVELSALDQQREKTRALKQAMMQELLTGRTRLV
jgi:type I restriction enzyme S subunit